MILRARTIVTMDGPPIDDGAVVVAGNQIADIGSFAEVHAHHGGEVFDLGEQVILPGLVNAHCHLDYTCLRRQIPPQGSFTDWIRTINAAKASLSTADYIESIRNGFEEAQRFGTTSIGNIASLPHLVSDIGVPPLRTWWFAELIDLRKPIDADRVLRDLRAHRLPSLDVGLSPHAPFTASAELYARVAAIARDQGVCVTTHVAESTEEMQMFASRSGALSEFISGIRPMDAAFGAVTPLAWMLNSCQPDEHWIVAHLNELTGNDLELLAVGPRFHVVHCPRSHAYFRHSRFQLENLRALGLNICLGTDSLASNTSLSMFDEMRAMQRSFASLSPLEILAMATVNGATALNRPNALGRVRAGFTADLIALPISGAGDIFEKIIAFDQPVTWTMIDGTAIPR
jgi:cytosine/adenosine deaminase-related metal-dependent hydrolase